LRVGLGRDLHRLAPGRPFLLGGVQIPFDKGEAAHSDGDVLCHAIIDALLGAAGEADIGELYPPTDARWKDAASLDLLARAWQTLADKGWRIVNIDAVVSAEAPPILPHRDAIRRSLAAALGIDAEAVFVKGKSGEGIGEIGRGEAVEAAAVCLLERTAGAVCLLEC
jgi:2-C-methyl-D-erythritol 2,4-cyclodiphosphate synthase/2-C-methyl-D-erythritol 4-phosphate cytidylyltransferase/2-C-methyl-D-erythritol 2,4-cyclodiphosphate synthase